MKRLEMRESSRKIYIFLLSCYFIDKLSNLNIYLYVNVRNKREIAGKINGSTYKITIISAANCPRVLNLA